MTEHEEPQSISAEWLVATVQQMAQQQKLLTAQVQALTLQVAERNGQWDVTAAQQDQIYTIGVMNATRIGMLSEQMQLVFDAAKPRKPQIIVPQQGGTA